MDLSFKGNLLIMQISVIIPAFNEEKYIEDCLKILATNLPKEVIEIIVVDNASTDQTSEIAKKFRKVRVVREDEKGLTKARQKGLLEAKGDLLAYVDADTQISTNWFEEIKKEFSEDNNVVCLSGPNYLLGVNHLNKVFVRLYWNLIAMPGYNITGHIVNGANFVAKKEALYKIGGFDTKIAFYGEDVDIGKRISKIGKMKFSKNLIVFSSARRFQSEGFLRVGIKYVANYLSEVLLHKPITKKYKDIR